MQRIKLICIGLVIAGGVALGVHGLAAFDTSKQAQGEVYRGEYIGGEEAGEVAQMPRFGGAPSFSFHESWIPQADSTYTLGTTSKKWLNVYTDQICLAGTCKVAWPTGGGGSGGGTWSTSTSQVANRLVNYPNNTTDIVVIGSTATTTANYYIDPNINYAFLKNASTTALSATTFCLSTDCRVAWPSAGAGGLATSTVDYIVSTTNGVVTALKTSTGAALSSNASADVVLNAVIADASNLGASISVKAGTYYLNATTTLPGTSDLNGSTWRILGNGQGSTNFVVNNNADAFFLKNSVKVDMRNFTIYLAGSANGITASSTSGYRSAWNSTFDSIAMTGTTSVSTGFGFNLINDDHNNFSNIYMTNIGNCFRSATDPLNHFNPGDATLSNVHCSFATPDNTGGSAPAANTFTSGVGYFFDGSAGTTVVNQDTLINVLAYDPGGTRTAFRFNHAKNMRGIGMEWEGFATGTEQYNSSITNNLDYEYVIGSTATKAYFFNDSTSNNNTTGCTYVDSQTGTQPLFTDQNTDAQNPNVLQGVNGGVCQLKGVGSFTFSTTSASIVHKVQGGPLGSAYNATNDKGLLFVAPNVQAATQLSAGTTSITKLFTGNLYLEGTANTVYTPSAFTALRAVIANTSQTNGNFADIDLSQYNSATNALVTGTRLMSIFRNHSTGLTDFAIVNGTREVMRATGEGNVAIATTTAFWGLTVASSTGPQIGLVDGSNTSNAWTMRSIANSLFFATSTNSSGATSTVSAFSISPNGGVTIGALRGCSGDVETDANGLLACGTDVSGAGGGTWPFTPVTYYGQGVQSTSTALKLTGSPFSLFASSTALFQQASTSLLTVSNLTSGHVTFAGGGGLLTDSANLTWDGSTFAAGPSAGPKFFATSNTGADSEDFQFFNVAGSFGEILAKNSASLIEITDAGVGSDIVLRAYNGTIATKAGTGKTYGILDFSGIDTSDKTFTFPNQSGTVCLVGVLCDGSGGAGVWPFTTGYYNGQVMSASSTGLMLTGSPIALVASTSIFSKVGIGSSTPWTELGIVGTTTMNGDLHIQSHPLSVEDVDFVTQNPFIVPGGFFCGIGFVPGLDAFRGGCDNDLTKWNTANIGNLSFAYGSDVIASGSQSFAIGDRTIASGDDSFAMGRDATASGIYSFAGGNNSLIQATGTNSFVWGTADAAAGSGTSGVAMGVGSRAYGDGALTIGGDENVSQSYCAMVGGAFSTCNPVYSGIFAGYNNVIVMGAGPTAHQFSTIIGGGNNTVNAYSAHTMGENLTVGADYAVTIGQGVSNTLRFVNNATSSLYIGFSSTIPTFVVSSSTDSNGTGNVGVSTTTPGTKFSIGSIANFAVATSTLYSGLTIAAGGLNVGTLTSSNCDLKADTSGNVTCGTDATGGGGSFPFDTTAYGVSTSTIVGFTGGLMSMASSTFSATTTFNAIKMTAAASGASVSTGGAFNLTNTSNDGAGMVLFTNHGASATGRLMSINCGNLLFDQNCFNLQSLGTQSTLNLSGAAAGLGVEKISGISGGVSNNSSSLLSLDSSVNSFMGQGIFAKCNSATTTPCLVARDASSNLMFSVDGSKLTTMINASSTQFTTTGSTWFTGSTGGVLVTDTAGLVSASTSLSVIRGGTSATSQSTGGIMYYDGTKITNAPGFYHDGTFLNFPSLVMSTGTALFNNLLLAEAGYSYVASTTAGTTFFLTGLQFCNLASLHVPMANTTTVTVIFPDDAAVSAACGGLLPGQYGPAMYANRSSFPLILGTTTGSALTFKFAAGNERTSYPPTLPASTTAFQLTMMTETNNVDLMLVEFNSIGSPATSTFNGISGTSLNLTSTTATSTAANGFNLTKGCFSINNICIGASTGDAFTHPIFTQSATTSTVLFNGGASTTILSVFQKAYFGGTATSTFDSAGALTLSAYAQFSKAQRVRWNDDNDSIMVSDAPTILPGKNNVMSFHVYDGSATDGVFVWGDYQNNPTMVLDAFSNKLGVGTSSPWATLSVVGDLTRPLFAVATSSTGTASSSEPIFMIDQNEHHITGGGQPTISSCGSSSGVNGNDNVMRITTGSGGVTECIINFAKTWLGNIPPVCNVDEEGTTATVTTRASSTVTQLKIGLSASLTSASLGVQCVGFQ